MLGAEDRTFGLSIPKDHVSVPGSVQARDWFTLFWETNWITNRKKGQNT